MPTTVTKTIGSGGDYTTLQAWEDAAPANLVTSDQIWRGEIMASTNFSSSTSLLTVSGSTTDATRYKELTVAAGASFADAAGVLRYNETYPYIKVTGGYETAINATENYFRLSRVQVKGAASTASPLRAINAGQRINQCILDGGHNTSYSQAVVLLDLGASIFNSLINRSYEGGSNWPTLLIGDSGIAVNCTVTTTVASTVTRGVSTNYATGYCRNVAAMNFAAGFFRSGNSGSFTFETCVQSDATNSYTGVTNSVAYSTANFNNITASSEDWRIPTGSALKDAGTTDSTNAATDIYGTSRPSGASYDIGAYEFVASGGGNTSTRRMLLGIG